jgi:hypothetical protein
MKCFFPLELIRYILSFDKEYRILGNGLLINIQRLICIPRPMIFLYVFTRIRTVRSYVLLKIVGTNKYIKIVLETVEEIAGDMILSEINIYVRDPWTRCDREDPVFKKTWTEKTKNKNKIPVD